MKGFGLLLAAPLIAIYWTNDLFHMLPQYNMDIADDESLQPPVSPEDEGPACQSCRKRKLRCSREHPTCTHCIRLDVTCTYDAKKNKPGIKAGVIDSLSRRIDALEEAASRTQLESPGLCSGNSSETKALFDILSHFAQEFKKADNSNKATLPVVHDDNSETSPSVRNSTILDSSSSVPNLSSRKRRRLENITTHKEPRDFVSDDIDALSNALPSPSTMDAVVSAYFSVVQPWIPILHEGRFRQKLSHPDERLQVVVVLHAMVVAALRHAKGLDLISEEIQLRSRQSRNLVMLAAMDGLSVENLQALIVVAFTDMGSGHPERAWPITGQLTRIVEYLQLTIERDQFEQNPPLRPTSLLQPAASWTEDEERRRVLWAVFNMDRFCSVTTGWNTSLTGDDVQRRLPADGGLWHKEKAVTTPYFGIWDKAAAKIGKSIAFIPAHYPSPASDESAQGRVSQSGDEAESSVDMSTVGAFAYCIEATESLSRVTTYFLQQRVNFRSRQEVSSWLTRFKELDLRLVHWKMFLPLKWRDSNVSPEPQRIEMDPNLTLAHLSHNASMILLHQTIAYPSKDWQEIVKLPSFCSAETCHNAAIETATITEKYIKYTPDESIVASQFAFCVFISAKVLLVHAKHYGTVIASEFWALLDNLQVLSRRWAGKTSTSWGKATDLAANLRRQLHDLHNRISTDASCIADILGYSNDGSFGHSTPHLLGRHHRTASSSGIRSRVYLNDKSSAVQMIRNAPSPQIVPLAAHDRRVSMNSSSHDLDGPASDLANQVLIESGYDELTDISHALLGQQFLEMDRIITYNDGYWAPNLLSPSVDGWQQQMNSLNYPL